MGLQGAKRSLQHSDLNGRVQNNVPELSGISQETFPAQGSLRMNQRTVWGARPFG